MGGKLRVAAGMQPATGFSRPVSTAILIAAQSSIAGCSGQFNINGAWRGANAASFNVLAHIDRNAGFWFVVTSPIWE